MKKFVTVGLLLCIVVCCISIWPIGVVRKNADIYPLLGVEYPKTEPGQEMTQVFTAQTGFLSEMAFDVGFPYGKPEEGKLIFSLCREKDGKELLEKMIDIQDVVDSAFTQLSINTWLVKGENYSYTIRAEADSGLAFQGIYTEDDADAALGSREMFFENAHVEGQAVTKYTYGYLLNYKNVICLWAFVWLIGLILLEIFTGKKILEGNKILSRVDALLTKWQFPILIMELAVILVMIVRICRNEAVHWDEAYTWQMVTKNDLWGMFKATAADVHPPLYYMLVMAAMKIFGKNIFVAKMVSVSATLATGILGITLVRKRWGVKTAIPFLMVAGLGTQMIYYSVDVRMYSWMTFFVLAAGLFAYEIMQSGKIGWWVAFTLMSLGGVYTQYFSVVPLAFLYLFLGIWILCRDRQQIIKWILCCVATVAGYLPWLSAVIDTLQRDSTGSREEGEITSFQDLCKWAFENNIKLSEYMPLVVLVATIVCLVVGYRSLLKKERDYIVFLGLLPFLSLGVCMILASHMSHFWTNRYLVDILLFLWLFMLIILSRRSLVIWGTGVIWLGVMVLSSYTIMQATELNTIPWIQDAKKLMEPLQEEEKVVYAFVTFDILYEYYLPDTEFIWYTDVDFSEMGDEFYMITWRGADFNYLLYKSGFLTKEFLGSMRLEEGAGSDILKITIDWSKLDNLP